MSVEKINPVSEEEKPGVQIDENQLNILMSKLQEEQNFRAGMIAGLAAAFIGAIIWAVLTVAIGYQIGWMAVGVGFLVGIAVRKFGKGVEKKFGFLGAFLSLVGCLAGNLFAIVAMAANQLNIPISVLAVFLNLEIISSLLVETFEVIDLLFYGIAVYEGYRFSFRTISEEELQGSTLR